MNKLIDQEDLDFELEPLNKQAEIIQELQSKLVKFKAIHEKCNSLNVEREKNQKLVKFCKKLIFENSKEKDIEFFMNKFLMNFNGSVNFIELKNVLDKLLMEKDISTMFSTFHEITKSV